MREYCRRLVRLSLYSALSAASLLHGCGADYEAQAPARKPNTSEQLAVAQSPRIERVTMEGEGCGNADPGAIRISAVRDTFAIDFEDFLVTAREEDQARDVACSVSVILEGPDGIAYAPAGLALELDTSAAAAVSVAGYWASMPGRRSVDASTSHERGRHLTGALNDRTLWSSCSGPRELRFTIKLGLGSRQGRAEFERLSGLHFYARECQDDGADQGSGSISIDAGMLDASSTDGQTEAAVVDASAADAGREGSPDYDASISAVSPSISSVNVAGTGCPGPAAIIRIPEGRDTFDVDFARFISEATPERTIRSTYCSLAVDVVVPEGQTIAVERFTAKGSASLTPNSTARLSAFYDYLGADGASGTKQVALVGPYEGKFALEAEFAEGDLLFRRCGDTRPIMFHISMIARTGEPAANVRASVESLGAVRFVVRSCR